MIIYLVFKKNTGLLNCYYWRLKSSFLQIRQQLCFFHGYRQSPIESIDILKNEFIFAKEFSAVLVCHKEESNNHFRLYYLLCKQAHQNGVCLTPQALCAFRYEMAVFSCVKGDFMNVNKLTQPRGCLETEAIVSGNCLEKQDFTTTTTTPYIKNSSENYRTRNSFLKNRL